MPVNLLHGLLVTCVSPAPGYVVQGTLREALDAGMLVNKSSGLHDIPIVLSLAHNVACAMAYLHQVRWTGT